MGLPRLVPSSRNSASPRSSALLARDASFTRVCRRASPKLAGTAFSEVGLYGVLGSGSPRRFRISPNWGIPRPSQAVLSCPRWLTPGRGPKHPFFLRPIEERVISTKRIIMLVTVALVMAAMTVASAMPALAGASKLEGIGSIRGLDAQCQRILTPSGNGNYKCSIKKGFVPEEGNEGGSGASVVDMPFYTSLGVLEGHLVRTPNGNYNLQAHAHP
jgi:hypothetical protein